MARRQSKRGSRRDRRTSTSDKTQQDPVIVQQKPAPEVIEAVRAMPEEERVVVPVPARAKAEVVGETDVLPTGGKYGQLELFTEEFIDSLAKNPADLLGYYDNAKKALQTKRSTNLPGDDAKAVKLAKRVAELRRILVGLGYPG